MGWVDDTGTVVPIPGLEGLDRIITGKATKGKKPRSCKTEKLGVGDYSKARRASMTRHSFHIDLQGVYSRRAGMCPQP